jgi:hypothetical protein
LNNIQTAYDVGCVFLGYDGPFPEHLGMSLRSLYVLGEQTAVKCDGGIDFLHDFTGLCREAAAPHSIRHDR